MQEPPAKRSSKLWKRVVVEVSSPGLTAKSGVGCDAKVRGRKEEIVQEGKVVHGLRHWKSRQW